MTLGQWLIGIKNKITALSTDYIIERGTDGIWTYEKWNSGKAEAWAGTERNTTSWAAWGNLYEGNNRWENIDLPSNLFSERPLIFPSITSMNASISGYEIQYTPNNLNRIAYIIPLRPNNPGSGTVKMYYSIKLEGKWK